MEWRWAGPALAAALACSSGVVHAQQIRLSGGKTAATIIHADTMPLRLAAKMLAGDLEKLTGTRPRTSADLADCARICIVMGEHNSPLMAKVAADTGLGLAPLAGQWERYARVSLPSRSHPSRRYLIIAGSDTRGTIWGTVDLTREMGVSAWEWWADVNIRKAGRLSIDGSYRLSASPSVKYRGIFLNDEDWGLQPWAAKTFEPETGDIGPKTYARIFELMWRLKANIIWPAMHESTRPFYTIPGNAEAARDHAIVMGTSHAEPMMRNNVREWDEQRQGPFNFFVNRDRMLDYWRTRAKEVQPFENVYTMGLRGKHDSEMEGAASPEQARDTLAEVIGLQRDILAGTQGKPAAQIPQALTLYKEVLDVYSLGLKVPEDVTLVWPEDNYGYLNQLSTPAEQARSGGAGIYYHISYFGRPHDYLWLATTHPALVREQTDRAWQMRARNIWIVNVGDIKPGEYLAQYFLDLAFDRGQAAKTPREHLTEWFARQFDPLLASELSALMTDYYDLAFERKPEFMGFNGVEPITPVNISDYVRNGGTEAEQRIDRYADLAARAEKLATRIPRDRQDAYFQLVLYPVRAAARFNERNLKLDLAALYTRRGRPVANLLADQAQAAQRQIDTDTLAYNALNGGKWRLIMDAAPRGLPVFAVPPFPHARIESRPGCAIDSSDLAVVAGRPARHHLTIYSWGEELSWSLAGQKGLSASQSGGILNPANGFQQRISLDYQGDPAARFGTVRCGKEDLPITGRLVVPADAKGPVELDHTTSLTAAEPIAPSRDWELVPGLGSRQKAMRSRLELATRRAPGDAEPLRYSFSTKEKTDAQLRIVALPVHPLTSANGVKLALRIDGGPLQTFDFETHGRSEEWKQNVLSNRAQRFLALPQLPAGSHLLEVFALDPGFLLDRIDVRLNGAAEPYGAPPLS